MSRDRSSIETPQSAPAFRSPSRCPLCGAEELDFLFPITYPPTHGQSFLEDEAPVPEGGFGIHSCQACRFRFSSPQPDGARLEALYRRTEGAYFAPLGEASSHRRRTYLRVLDLAARLGVRKGKLLDVGCGTGGALRAFSEAFVAEGVEPSHYAAEVARRSGAIVHAGGLLSAAFADDSFDVVTAFDVLEHLAEPLAALKEMGRVLRPGGVLVVETGNMDSWNARLSGGRWCYLRLPGHLSFFSPRPLTTLLPLLGFEGVVCSRTHHGPLDASTLVGYARILVRHLLVRVLGARALPRPFFRSPDADYSVPYFFDHMLVAARRAAPIGGGNRL